MRLLKTGRWITALGFALLAAVYVRAVAFTPVERMQGVAQKIFYLHVPAAIWTETGMVLVGVASVFFLFLKDPRLAWWTWDARLTLTLLLFLMYVGYLLLRGAVTDPGLRARYAAVLGISGMCLVPFVHLSVYMFRTLHPQPIVLKPSAPSLPGAMLATLAFSFLAFSTLYVGFVTQRYALSLLREQADQHA